MTFAALVNQIIAFIGQLVPLLYGVALVAIIWKVIDAWIINAEDETKRKDGKVFIINAIAVLVVITSIWGIVALIRNGFGLVQEV